MKVKFLKSAEGFEAGEVVILEAVLAEKLAASGVVEIIDEVKADESKPKKKNK